MSNKDYLPIEPGYYWFKAQDTPWREPVSITIEGYGGKPVTYLRRFGKQQVALRTMSDLAYHGSLQERIE